MFCLEIDNCSTEHSLPNSPSRLNDTETCRTLVSMFINQRRANLDLEQQLKHLQSSIKPDEHPTHSFGKYFPSTHFASLKILFLASSLSTSTGYSSGSSIDGSSTILSAFSSRSNSSLSERSKTSPTSFKPILPVKYQINTNEDRNNNLEQLQTAKRRKISNFEVCC